MHSVKSFGHAPEHNVHHYLCETIGCGGHPEAFVLPTGESLWAAKYDDEYFTFSEPVTSDARKAPLLLAGIEHMFSLPGIKKVVLELHDSSREALLGILPKTLRAIKPRYILHWPLFDIHSYDSQLGGKKFKKLRNTLNRFRATHQLAVVPTSSVAREDLINVVRAWNGNRNRNDYAYTAAYERHIQEGFPAALSARAMLVDGRVVGFNAGWEVPNRPGLYYASIGLHDYSIEGLGVAMYVEDFDWIKAHGYTVADLAGTEGNCTNFKKQFGPKSFYRSTIFAIARA